MEFKVYLAGPITGLTYGDSVDWRAYAINKLHDLGLAGGHKIVGYSPMRGKAYLRHEVKLRDGAYNQTIMSNDHSIVARDFNDCRTADAILVNFLDPTMVSIGTILEIGFAKALNVPVVLCIEPYNDDPALRNVHDHGMVRDIAGFRCETLDEGLVTIAKLLLP